jgi:very-short-patch-repair endonuclease
MNPKVIHAQRACEAAKARQAVVDAFREFSRYHRLRVSAELDGYQHTAEEAADLERAAWVEYERACEGGP